MKEYSRYIYISVLLFYCSSSSWCQENKIVNLTKYTQNQGLSSYYVTKILKDKYGFMWVGTQEGLNLFDGNNFQIFSKLNEDKKRLGGLFIADLAEDDKRSLLWVLTSYGNICAIDLKTRIIKKRIEIDESKQPLSTKWIRSIAVQGDTLWFGGLGVFCGFDINSNSFINTELLDTSGLSKEESNISKITVDKANRLWIFCDGYGIIILNKQMNVVNVYRSELNDGRIESRKLRFWEVGFHNDELYVGTSWGLRSFNVNTNSITYLKSSSHMITDTAEILSLAFTSSNQMIFSTSNGFWSKDLTTKTLASYHDQDIDEDWLSLTYQSFYDSLANKIWVGTQSGLASFDAGKTAFDIFGRSSSSKIRIKHAFSLLPADSNHVYCGDENGVYYTSIKDREILKLDDGSSNLLLFKDKLRNVFLSNKAGLFIIRKKSLVPIHRIYPSLKSLENDQFNCAAQYNDSILLFGSVIQKGLSVWNNRSGELKIFHSDSVKNNMKGLTVINNLFKDKAGNTFVLTEKSIIDFNPLTMRYKTYTIKINRITEPIGNFMDMCETPESYWLATYGDGVIETDKNFRVKRRFSTAEGLGNNCVYKIFYCNNQSIILSTNNGLSTIDCKTFKTQKYFQSDGLHSSNFEQVCGYQSENKIYFGGVNGFTVVDPAILFSNPTPPTLYINNVIIQTNKSKIDTSNIFLKELEIPNNVVQVTISLAGLNYKNPARTSYSYKINKDQTEWVELGTQNFVDLPPLPPGKYELVFRSANEAGVWNKSPITLILIYLPKWYQTILFKLILVAFGITIFYLLYRYRISQIRKQHLIRKNIASDLHDDIGSTLNTVKVFTHLAKRDSNKEVYLDEIESALTDATMGLRDMIWVLDDAADNTANLIDRIKKFASPVTSACGINFKSIQSNDWKDYGLTKTEKRNLLLMLKEIINNSIKYSCCKTICIHFGVFGNKKTIQVSDDGKGFDTQTPSQGNGLDNLKFRAEQIGYKVTIVSSNNNGTTVLIEK